MSSKSYRSVIQSTHSFISSTCCWDSAFMATQKSSRSSGEVIKPVRACSTMTSMGFVIRDIGIVGSSSVSALHAALFVSVIFVLCFSCSGPMRRSLCHLLGSVLVFFFVVVSTWQSYLVRVARKRSRINVNSWFVGSGVWQGDGCRFEIRSMAAR